MLFAIYQLVAYVLYFLLFALTGEYRPKEKRPQNQKKNDNFKQNNPPKLSPPSHILEAFNIEIVYSNNCPLHNNFNFTL